ncbi:chorismate mutase [Streptomyces zingiberis]|uniref:Chorismate mutase n=1 Tax=Streptomyces zingiberis TaxID=2053010 RepID=A0ABX1BXF5_9ACTN|nr:chorismate mutase [Streptomyces zingiberis]NJQ01108.1 chorismate mutase [Streptomyces zingiberis]
MEEVEVEQHENHRNHLNDENHLNRENHPTHENTASEADRRIEQAREVIDALDLQLMDLLRHRRAVSLEIQQQRMGQGGTRTVLSRENVVLDRYAAGLGPEGTALALTILSLCRGRATASVPRQGGPARVAS